MEMCEGETESVRSEVLDGGEWCSELTHNIHGKQTVKLDVDGPVMLMGLPTHHGWRAITSVKLNHQIKVEEIADWVEENPMCREVAALAVDAGEWEKIWTQKNEELKADAR